MPMSERAPVPVSRMCKLLKSSFRVLSCIRAYCLPQLISITSWCFGRSACISGYPVSMKKHQCLLLMYSLTCRSYEQLVSAKFCNLLNSVSHIYLVQSKIYKYHKLDAKAAATKTGINFVQK